MCWQASSNGWVTAAFIPRLGLPWPPGVVFQGAIPTAGQAGTGRPAEFVPGTRGTLKPLWTTLGVREGGGQARALLPDAESGPEDGLDGSPGAPRARARQLCWPRLGWRSQGGRKAQQIHARPRLAGAGPPADTPAGGGGLSGRGFQAGSSPSRPAAGPPAQIEGAGAARGGLRLSQRRAKGNAAGGDGTGAGGSLRRPPRPLGWGSGRSLAGLPPPPHPLSSPPRPPLPGSRRALPWRIHAAAAAERGEVRPALPLHGVSFSGRATPLLGLATPPPTPQARRSGRVAAFGTLCL